MKCVDIEVQKLMSALNLSLFYFDCKNQLKEKQDRVERLCHAYKTKLLKVGIKAGMGAHSVDKVEHDVEQIVGAFRIRLYEKHGIYDLMDKLYGVVGQDGLEKCVMVKNNNPLHDNMVPEKVTVFRSNYEKLLAKYGFGFFSFSHKSPEGGKSDFDCLLDELKKQTGRAYLDATILVRDGDGITAHKVILKDDLAKYCAGSFVFANEDDYAKFLKNNEAYEYHCRYGMEDEVKLHYYIDKQCDFDFFSKFVYADNIDFAELNKNKCIVDAILSVYRNKFSQVALVTKNEKTK